jgi:hypothetical protein
LNLSPEALSRDVVSLTLRSGHRKATALLSAAGDLTNPPLDKKP